MTHAENTTTAPNEQASRCLSPKARLRRQEGVILCHVDSKHMLVPAMTNKVDLDSLFLLNDTGAYVWEHLNGIRPLHDLGKAVARAFFTDLATATQDVTLFLTDMLEHNLVEIVGGW